MGKKRKTNGYAPKTTPASGSTIPANSKFAVEETFDNSEDEFAAGRDEILLAERPEAKRRRKLAEQEELLQPSDEEIMAYQSVDENGLDEEDDSDEDEDYDNDKGEDRYGVNRSAKNSERISKPDDESEGDGGIAAWGLSKRDLYNADRIETEADAMNEEEEAKRLQQNRLQAMKDEDFGFDETEWADTANAAGPEDGTDVGVVTEILPQMEIPDMPTNEQLKILKSRYPEFEPLAKDLADLQRTHRTLGETVKSCERDVIVENLSTPAPVDQIKFRALSAYLGAISIYFVLLASPSQQSTATSSPLPPAELRKHPVMRSLVKFRKLWEQVKDITVPDLRIAEKKPIGSPSHVPEKAKSTTDRTKKSRRLKQKKRLTTAQRAAEAAQAEAKAQRAERILQTEAGLVDLSKLVADSRKILKAQKQKTKVSIMNEYESDFGDEDTLTAKEAEEKAKRKRSLRFYTSQIAQKSNKRNAAGREAGGDADIPYRERLKDRQARLNAEAQKRGNQRPEGLEELGGNSDEEDDRVAAELRNDGSASDGEDYYDMISARSKQLRDKKKAIAEAYTAAARERGHVEIQDEIGPDGKRAISYQIEKNKGLAPKRNKDFRNPRVKKRKKFEQKKKKLGSVRQIYKGGEGPGGYGGELTGIKKNLVKSVKL